MPCREPARHIEILNIALIIAHLVQIWNHIGYLVSTAVGRTDHYVDFATIAEESQRNLNALAPLVGGA